MPQKRKTQHFQMRFELLEISMDMNLELLVWYFLQICVLQNLIYSV